MHTPNTASRSPVEKVHTPAISDCGAFAPGSRAGTDYARGPASVSPVHKQTTPRNDAVSQAGTRSKFIKVRVSPDEYAGIARQADIASQNMSEYVREQVLAVHRTLDLKAEFASLRGLMSAPARSTDDSLVREAVFLLRELAAARDEIIPRRVHVQMNEGNQPGGESASNAGTAGAAGRDCNLALGGDTSVGCITLQPRDREATAC